MNIVLIRNIENKTFDSILGNIIKLVQSQQYSTSLLPMQREVGDGGEQPAVFGYSLLDVEPTVPLHEQFRFCICFANLLRNKDKNKAFHINIVVFILMLNLLFNAKLLKGSEPNLEFVANHI